MQTTLGILIVEDERVVALDLRIMLQDLGYRVVGIAGNGTDAIAKATTLQPNLILMDIRLHGDVDGIEAARQIRVRLDVPVIYLTAYADNETRARARSTKPYGYLVKPFDERTLQTTIDMSLERHALDREMRASQQWFATTLASLSDGVVTTDSSGSITFVNTVATQLLQCRPGDLIGQPIVEAMQLYDSQMRQLLPHPITAALHHKGSSVTLADTLLTTPTGLTLTIDGSVAPIVLPPDTLLGAVLVWRDASQRRAAEALLLKEQQLQEEARQRQRLRVLAGGIAHDLNNILTSILGYTQLAQGEPDVAPAIDESLVQVVEHTHRAANLARRLQTYASRSPPQREQVDLHSIVRETLLLRSAALRERFVQTNLPDTALQVEGDPSQLHQVIMNLLVNAAEASLGSDGAITLTASLAHTPFALPNCRIELKPGPYIMLSVSDCGTGIDAATLERIFEPFFTTKFAGRGLGLAMVYTIVQDHGGAIGVSSQVGQGTTFTVVLPASSAAPARGIAYTPADGGDSGALSA